MTPDQIPPSESEAEPSKMLKSHRALVNSTRGSSSAMFLGSSFALATGVLGWGGHMLDLKMNSEPWFTLLGICIAFLYGGYEVWKLSRKSQEPPASHE